MVRKLAVAALVLASFGVSALSVQAAPPISPNNPYRSFNISGVNYGAVQWEQQHHGSRWRSTPYGVNSFRRR